MCVVLMCMLWKSMSNGADPTLVQGLTNLHVQNRLQACSRAQLFYGYYMYPCIPAAVLHSIAIRIYTRRQIYTCEITYSSLRLSVPDPDCFYNICFAYLHMHTIDDFTRVKSPTPVSGCLQIRTVSSIQYLFRKCIR